MKTFLKNIYNIVCFWFVKPTKTNPKIIITKTGYIKTYHTPNNKIIEKSIKTDVGVFVRKKLS